MSRHNRDRRKGRANCPRCGNPLDRGLLAAAEANRRQLKAAFGADPPPCVHHCGRCGCYFYWGRERRPLTPAEELALRVENEAVCNAADFLYETDDPRSVEFIAPYSGPNP